MISYDQSEENGSARQNFVEKNNWSLFLQSQNLVTVIRGNTTWPFPYLVKCRYQEQHALLILSRCCFTLISAYRAEAGYGLGIIGTSDVCYTMLRSSDTCIKSIFGFIVPDLISGFPFELFMIRMWFTAVFCTVVFSNHSSFLITFYTICFPLL